MKAFIEKNLRINYALQIEGMRSMTRAKPYSGTLWHRYNKQLPMTTAMKISLNTSNFINTKFRPYEMKNKDIVAYIYIYIYIYIWSNENLFIYCIMEFWMYVFGPGFLLPIGVMK